MLAFLQGKKTYILVTLGVLALLINFLSGDITLMQFLSSEKLTELIGLLGLGTIRAGVAASK